MKQFSIYLELIKSIYRSDVDRCKVNSKDDLFLDYIYCLNYQEDPNVHTDFQSLEVTDTTISCNLEQTSFPRAKAIYSYQATDTDEISLSENEIVEVYEEGQFEFSCQN